MEGENLTRNVATAAFLAQLAAETGHAPAQLAVAWLLSRGDDIVPLLGVNRRARLTESLAALDIQLTADQRSALDKHFAPGAIVGDRYPAFVQKLAAR